MLGRVGAIWVVPIAVISLTLLAWPTVAEACSPRIDDAEVLPDDKSEQVPTNTKIWILGAVGQLVTRGQWDQVCGSDEPRLLTAEGQVVATRVERLPNGIALVPERELSMGKRYRVAIECSAHSVESVEFTVTAAEDSSAPAAPNVELGELEVGSDECVKWRYRTMTASGGEPLYAVEFDGAAPGFTARLTSLGRKFGRSIPAIPWPGGDSATARFASVDLAGNHSDWTDATTVSLRRIPLPLPSPSGCGCRSAGSGSDRVSGLLALLVGLGLLRRRRARSATKQ